MPASEATADELSFHMQALLVLACGIAYFYAYKLNMHWFDWFEFSHGTNWIFIPSGLRLLFVLVLARTGAIGIALSSVAVNYSFGNPDTHLFDLVTGLISGGAPYLARHLSLTWFGLDSQLANLNARTFFNISIVFAVVNAVMHQLWFVWNGHTENFITSTLAMIIGDWFGTVLVLATASLVIKLFQTKQHTPL